MADRVEPHVLPSEREKALRQSSIAAAADPPERCCDDENTACKICRKMEARVVSSDELLQGSRELLIVHAGQVYRLLRTRNNKLILQK